MFTCVQSRADGIILDALSPIAAGRGGTNLAFADNGSILLDNPSSLSNIVGSGLFDFNAAVLFSDLDYSDPQNSTNGRLQPPENPSAALALSYICKGANEDWAYGFGVFTPAGFGTDLNQNTTFAGKQMYRSLAALTKIMPAVSYRVNDSLSIGGAMGMAVHHLELEAPYVIQTGALAGTPTLLDFQVTDLAPAFTVGAQYRLSDCTTLGLAYTDETRFTMDDGEATVQAGPVASHYDFAIDFVYPRTLGLGVKHELSECRRVSADVIWFDWSHALDRFDLAVTSGDSALLPARIKDTFPLDWRDTVSVKLGYEWLASACETWRAGYVYHRNPVPDSTLTSYIPAILEHAFTLGYSRTWGNCTLDLGYMFTFGTERSVSGSRIVGPLGGPSDWDGSELKLQYHMLYTGVSVRF